MKKRRKMFSFPAAALGGVLVCVYAGRGVSVQNYDAFLTCGPGLMRLSTENGIVRIEGFGMDVALMETDCVSITGDIICVSFEAGI